MEKIMEHQNEEMEIDLLELFYYLKKRLWIIAIAFVVCAIIGYVFSAFFMAPEYTANTRMYVLNRSSETNVNYSDFQVSSYMLNDYKVLITGENVTKEVVKRLDLDIEYDALAERIVVESPNDTRVLQISITDTDAQRAANIANAVREIAALQIKDIMDVEAVKVVYEAHVPTEKSGPSVMKNTVIAAALGLIASIGVLAVIFIMDDTIHTEEDVEKYLGLSVLGVVPDSPEMNSFSDVAKRVVRKTADAGQNN